MKRPPIPRKLRAQAMAKNSGICMHESCTKPGEIAEHVIPWYFVQEHTLDNLEPRCREHATAKTKLDQANIGHVRRMAGETGQYARRTARKAKGQKPLIQSNPKIASRPWPKKLKEAQQ